MTNQTETTTDPGHTPGQAEGVPEGQDQSKREPEPTSRTQDEAEGYPNVEDGTAPVNSP